MSTGVIDKHLQHQQAELVKQAGHQHKQEVQEKLHLNKNIGVPSL